MRIDINNCTLQEAMDYAVQRIVEQGGRCGSRDRSGNFYCMYSDGKGKHCAVGWLIPEDILRHLNVVMGIGGLVIAKRDVLPKLIVENDLAMSYLQCFHDAGTRKQREHHYEAISCLGIDTSGPHWQAWIDMGE